MRYHEPDNDVYLLLAWGLVLSSYRLKGRYYRLRELALWSEVQQQPTCCPQNLREVDAATLGCVFPYAQTWDFRCEGL